MFANLHKIFDSLTEKEHQIFRGAVLILLVSFILNAVNLFYRGTTLAPVPGGSYVEGQVGQPIAVNPVLSGGNETDNDLLEILFSDLAEISKSSKLGSDQKSWTVELKEKLSWSDGKPLTAEDVIFTVKTIQDAESRSPLASSWQGVRVDKLNEREIRFTLRTPYSFFEENLEDLKIIPKHIFGSIPPANLRISDYNFEPVGNGPYAFSKLIKRKDGFISEYHLKTNELFEGEKPLIKNFIFRFFPSYEEAIEAFNRKEIDGLGGISVQNLNKIKIGYETREISIPRYYAIFFNQATAPALKNAEVREALELSLDREKIINSVFMNKASAIAGPILPSTEGYNADSAKFEFSPDKALEILNKSGWDIKDGIMVKKIKNEEVKLEFEIVVPEIDFLAETAKIIAEDWDKIGVKLTLVNSPPSLIANETIKTRNYQMIIFGNILKSGPDIFSFWHSSERFHPGLNLALYENKSVDNLLEAIRTSHNRAARIKNTAEIQKIIRADRPAIFLFSPKFLYAAPKNLGGFTVKPMEKPSKRFENVNKWYLETARVFK